MLALPGVEMKGMGGSVCASGESHPLLGPSLSSANVSSGMMFWIVRVRLSRSFTPTGQVSFIGGLGGDIHTSHS